MCLCYIWIWFPGAFVPRATERAAAIATEVRVCVAAHRAMDELVSAATASSCVSPSPSSFSTPGHVPQLEFVSWDLPEQWMGDDNWVDEALDLLDGSPPWGVGDESSLAAGNDAMTDEPPAPPAPKRRGRKPGPRPQTDGPVLTHVEAERQRRDKLNRRFCELRAVVPTVSRMDKASLLADAAAYIAELRDRVKQLEADAKQQASAAAAGTHCCYSLDLDLEVRMVGREVAALRLTTAARHASMRLMVALRSLDLPVQQACVCSVGGVTVQDAVVGVPAGGLLDERGLRAALLHRLQRSG
ncbi:hypothetical protein BS78_07G215400 [Paspalum vaginatum]|nr:hypothetical protein BS78_07G215400 [Paspalum vaginatum]